MLPALLNISRILLPNDGFSGFKGSSSSASETFGFTGQNTVLSAEGGYLKGVGTGKDQAIILRRQFSSKYNVLRVGIRYDEGLELKGPEMFYQRAGMSGFTAEQLSYRTNLSVATINRLKAGQNLSIHGICALADALNKDWRVFFA